MFKTLRGRLITLFIVTVISGWQLYDKQLMLGLDLQGGMHILLEVDDPEGTMTPEAKSDMIDQVVRIIRTRIDEFGVNEPLIQKVGSERVIVELAGLQGDEDRAKEIVQRNAYLEFKLVLPTTDMDSALPRIDRAIVTTLGIDSIRAMGRDVVGNDQQALQDLLLGGGASTSDDAGADSTEA